MSLPASVFRFECLSAVGQTLRLRALIEMTESEAAQIAIAQLDDTDLRGGRTLNSNGVRSKDAAGGNSGRRLILSGNRGQQGSR